MATSLKPDISQQYVDFDEYIDFQLQKTRSNIKLTDILTALAGVATLSLGYFLVFTALDHWIISGGFGNTARVLMFSVLLLASLSWLAWKVVVPYFKSVTGLFAASVIEESEPGLKSTLLNLIDLRRSGREIPENIRTSLEKRAAVSLSHMDVEQAVDRRQLMQFSYALLAVVVLCCLYTLFSPKEISFWRAFLPSANVAVSTQTEILNVKPGDAEVLARTQLEVVADLRGDVPEQVNLLYTTADNTYVDEPIQMRRVEDELKRYRGLITGENGRGLLQNMTYRIVAGDAVSRDFQVTVIQAPSATVNEVRYEFPPYMRLSPKIREVGHIDAWEGTKVRLTATANMPLRSAVLVFSDDEQSEARAEEVRLKIVDGVTLIAEWELKIRSDGTYPHFYRIECKNEQGQRDPKPTLYHVKIHPDRPPQVTLLDPNHDLELPANSIIPLLVEARDPDFVLRNVTLQIEKQGEQLSGTPTIFEGRRQSFRGTFDWDLKPHQLKPGDELTFWIEARDNRQPLWNRKTTPPLKLRIIDAVSEQEAEEQLQADKQRQQQLLEETEESEEDQNLDETQQPEDGTDEEAGEQPGSGEESKPGDENSQNQNQSEEGKDADSENGKDGSESDQPSEGDQQDGEKLDPEDDADAQEVLEKLMQRQREKQAEQGDQKDQQPSEQASQDKQDPQQPGDQPSQDKQDPQQPGSHDPEKQDATGQPDRPDSEQSEGDGQDRQGPDDKQRPDDNKDPAGKQDPDATPGTQGDGGNEPTDDSNPGGSQGNPTDDESQTNESQSGPGNKPSNTKQTGTQSDGPPMGEEQPAEDSNDAIRQKADGDERGDATPDKDPDADPTPANNEVKRKSGEEAVIRKRQDEADPNAQQNMGNESKQGDTDNTGSQNPRDADPTKFRKGDQPNPDQDSLKPESKGDDEPKGQGLPEGQNSDQPQGGEPGASKQNEQGTSGSDNPGAGDSSNNPGDVETSDQPSDGKPGDSPEGGSKSENAGENKGGDSQPNGSQEGSEGQGQGESPQQSGAQPGRGGDQSGDIGSDADLSDSPGGGAQGGPNQQAGRGEGGSGGGQAAEQANLEDARKAANLVLKRLENELARGEVDQKLLDELGWTKKDMQKFAERLRQQLHNRGDDNSPESQARRRQFEETLKSLNLRSKGSRRRGDNVLKQTPSSGFGAGRLRVPAEYRDAVDAYTRSLSKRTKSKRTKQVNP